MGAQEYIQDIYISDATNNGLPKNLTYPPEAPAASVSIRKDSWKIERYSTNFVPEKRQIRVLSSLPKKEKEPRNCISKQSPGHIARFGRFVVWLLNEATT